MNSMIKIVLNLSRLPAMFRQCRFLYLLVSSRPIAECREWLLVIQTVERLKDENPS